MSIEMHVLFKGTLPAKAAVTDKMQELGFPFSIEDPHESLETQRGYMPMRFRGAETGVQFDVFEDGDLLQDFADANPDQKFERSANFRWSSDETEMLCAMCACAALAILVDGLVLDEFSDGPLSQQQAIELARETLASVAPADRA